MKNAMPPTAAAKPDAADLPDDLQLPIEPRAPAGLMRAAIAEQVKALLAHAPQVIGGEAGEALHELRISSRRLRAVVKSYGPILPGQARRAHEAALKKLTDALGPAREWDVHRENIEKEREKAESPVEKEALGWLAARVRARAAEEHEEMSLAVGALDIASLAARTLALPAQAERGPDVAAVARETLRALRADLRECAREACEHDDVSEMHLARIAAKKLRYALEVLEPAFAARGPEAAALRHRAHARAKKLQDVLGKHHDKALLEEIVAEGLLRLASLGLEALAEGLLPPLARLVEAQEEKRREFLELAHEGKLDEEIDPALAALA